MKNRILKLLILVLTLALCSGVFTACKGLDFLKSVVSCGGDAIGEIIHKHEYSSSYSYDDGYHWFECECGEDKSKGKHILVDGVCVCGYKNDKDVHSHDYNVLKFDETNHWNECECGEKINVEAHKGGTATETEKAVCEVCSQSYGEILDHVHNYEPYVLLPNCYAQGYTIYTCACGDYYAGDYVPALGHNYGAFTSNGNGTHTKVCANDNSHTETENCSGGVATETQKAVCVVCNGEYGELLSHTHNYTQTVTAPTCENKGFTTYTCSCGDSYVDNYVNALGHNYGAFTSNGNGTHTKVCANDNTHKITENCSGGQATETQKAICAVCNGEYGELLSHTHNYTQTVTAPTCENKGYTTYTCACGDSFIASQVNALGHNYGAFTSNGNGTHTKVCANDNTHKITENCSGGQATETQKAICAVCNGEYGELLSHTHNYTQIKTAPTCENKGYTTYTCACGDSFIASQVNALGHNYGAFTSNGNGTHSKVCVNDNSHVITENCSGGIATATQKAVCEVCNGEYGELISHEGEIIWVKHLDYHYQVYSCCYEQVSAPELHRKVNGVCSKCGFKPTITATTVDAQPGDTQVKIEISIADNPGITGLMLTVEYNDNFFTMTDAENGQALQDLAFTPADQLKNGCAFLWDGIEISDENIKDGNILTLTFNVSSNVFAGEYGIWLKVRAYDNDLNSFTLNIISGKIVINN